MLKCLFVFFYAVNEEQTVFADAPNRVRWKSSSNIYNWFGWLRFEIKLIENAMEKELDIK